MSSRNLKEVQEELLQASKKGDLQTAIAMLDLGADLDAVDHEGYSALHNACYGGHEEIVQVLVNKRANLTSKSRKWGEGPLHCGTVAGNEKVIQILLEAGADFSACCAAGRSALHLASEHGFIAALRLLIEKRADIDAEDHEGYSALHTACFSGREEIVQVLVHERANLTSQGREYGESPFHCATVSGNEKVIQILLHAGASTTAICKGGGSVLHWASQHGFVPVLQRLLDARADLAAEDFECRASLAWAAVEGHDKAVEFLLARDCSGIDYWDRTGKTALHHAAMKGFLRVVNVLLSKGADPNPQDTEGVRPLGLAARNDHSEVVSALLVARAELNAVDGIGRTALIWAASTVESTGGHYEVAVVLTRDRSRIIGSIDLTDSYGKSALHWASECGYDKMVKLLIESGAKIDAVTSEGVPEHEKLWRDTLGCSSLHLSALGGCDLVAKYLVEQRANVLLEDAKGRTPGELAKGKAELASYLHEAAVEAWPRQLLKEVVEVRLEGLGFSYHVRSLLRHDITQRRLQPKALKDTLSDNDLEKIRKDEITHDKIRELCSSLGYEMSDQPLPRERRRGKGDQVDFQIQNPLVPRPEEVQVSVEWLLRFALELKEASQPTSPWPEKQSQIELELWVESHPYFCPPGAKNKYRYLEIRALITGLIKAKVLRKEPPNSPREFEYVLEVDGAEELLKAAFAKPEAPKAASTPPAQCPSPSRESDTISTDIQGSSSNDSSPTETGTSSGRDGPEVAAPAAEVTPLSLERVGHLAPETPAQHTPDVLQSTFSRPTAREQLPAPQTPAQSIALTPLWLRHRDGPQGDSVQESLSLQMPMQFPEPAWGACPPTQRAAPQPWQRPYPQAIREEHHPAQPLAGRSSGQSPQGPPGLPTEVHLYPLLSSWMPQPLAASPGMASHSSQLRTKQPPSADFLTQLVASQRQQQQQMMAAMQQHTLILQQQGFQQMQSLMQQMNEAHQRQLETFLPAQVMDSL